MSQNYPHLFQPIRIGPVEVPNRFFFSPHGVPLTADSSPSDDAVAYFGARAAGGTGLIIQSLAIGSRSIGRISPLEESRIDSFAVLADHIHDNGAKLFGQLHHSWPTRMYQWEPMGPSAPSLSPSVNPRFEHFAVSREMSLLDIESFQADLRKCVRNLRRAGYDGIEVHVTHGLLLEHFLSPYFNHRTDEYGGSLENRLRMIVESLEIAREEAAGELAVGIRYNCDEMVPKGITSQMASEALEYLVARNLLDYANLDVAIEPNQFPLGMPSYFVEKLAYESFVKDVRGSAGSVPVLATLSRVTDMADTERAIATGICDAVGAARGLMAEPELMKNAKNGQEERSRICIACNACLFADGFHCAINPAMGREKRWGVETFAPAAHPGRVVVVGAGPAGCEAAITAAKKGHSVVLFEKADRIGGQLNLWAVLPGREVIATTRDWYEREIKRHGVELRLGTEATSESVLAENPDAVIVATGAFFDPEGKCGFLAVAVPGYERDFVYTPEQILRDGLRPTGRVIILDDESKNTGSGLAELLAANGAEVEVITRWLQPVYNMSVFEVPYAIKRMKALGVKLSTGEYIKEIGDHVVTVFDVIVNSERVIDNVDAVIFTNMRNPINAIASDLEGRVKQVFAVGDALAPRALAEATHEGHRFARKLGEPGAPANFTEAWNEPIPREAFGRPAAMMKNK